MTARHLDPARRHDAVLLFDVVDGNPNGDPDAGNLPRVDPETMQGLVSDVAIKRKVRNWVEARREGEPRYKIYVQGETPLNEMHQRAYDATGTTSTGNRQKRDDVDRARAWMCENFFDIRTFGAVMSTGVNAGQVRGPVQLTFSRSLDPIVPMEMAITRIAITRGEDARGEDGEGGKQTEIGRKAIVPYGLYRGSVFVTPKFAADTGFSSDDLDMVWQSLINMWDLDRSAARGAMACRGLIVFSHDHALGNAPAHRLMDLVTVRREGDGPPRAFSDYTVEIDETGVPEGVSVTRLG
jgi:CRISPR-associated protein Csd2